jgi:hypothetical protein
MAMTRIALALATFVVVAALWFLHGDAPVIAPAPPAEPTAPVEAPVRIATPPAPRLSVATRVPPEPAPQPAPSTDDAPAAPSPAELRDGLEAHFRHASADATSGEAARVIGHQLPAILPAGSTVRSVACRDSLCRIEAVHVGVAEHRQFVQRAFLEPTRVASDGFYAGLLDEPAAGQPVTTVAYLARAGHVMPAPDDLAP